ncbi:hypothetical protein [Saccharothrix longispora]|uniref:hypothetical protein n=1 Tax=Saccharothrix longispora TaxID=33920 RepID=UPI0028FDB529|nr:hypothetical protein [Saccharothrix longispora]MDU0294966.1 hypothetical protein [Saccharothrix longispora]
MLIAVTRTLGGPTPGVLAEVVVVYERAATAPHRVQPVRWAEVAVELRTAARDLLKAGTFSRSNSTGLLAAALILALVALLVQIAAWRQLSQQQAQATAATQAAAMMNTYSADLATRRTPSPAPDQPHPNQSRPVNDQRYNRPWYDDHGSCHQTRPPNAHNERAERRIIPAFRAVCPALLFRHRVGSAQELRRLETLTFALPAQSSKPLISANGESQVQVVLVSWVIGAIVTSCHSSYGVPKVGHVLSPAVRLLWVRTR